MLLLYTFGLFDYWDWGCVLFCLGFGFVLTWVVIGTEAHVSHSSEVVETFCIGSLDT